MKVRYSKQVKDALSQYKRALNRYPISNDRKKEKIRMLSYFLKTTIPQTIESLPVCEWKDLGQTYDLDGKPENKNLKFKEYSDKAYRPWSFSFYVSYEENIIVVYRMIYSAYVKESKCNDMKYILSFDSYTHLQNYMLQD